MTSLIHIFDFICTQNKEMKTATDELLIEFKFKSKIALRWSDIDEAGHVNNAVYLTYLEESRVVYFHESCRWDWKKDGVILANANVNYKRPLFYPEPTFVYVRVSKIGGKSIELQYAITVEKEDNIELVSTASTILVMFDYKKQTSVEVPDYIRKAIGDFEQKSF
jgi:acyl-CoA thioester hydrolase